jgi:hypothetical protein
VTSRYVQKFFANKGVTVSEFVLERRLAVAYRLIRDQQKSSPAYVAVISAVG